MRNSFVKLSIIFVYVIFVFSTSTDVGANDFYPDERDALLELRDRMDSNANLHAKWTGPPCYNNQSKWVGISCYNSHVTQLVLEGIELKGSLPDSFLQNLTYLTKLSLRNNLVYGALPELANLIQLEYVLLSNNSFSGSIPKGYVQLPQLKELELQDNVLVGSIPPFEQLSLTDFNVSYNQLSGLIPLTQTLMSFPRSSYDHNLDLCGEIVGIPCPILPPAPTPGSPKRRDQKKKRLQVYIIALIATAAAVVPFLVVLALMCYSRKVRRGENKEGKAKDIEKKKNWSNSSDGPERTTELAFFDNDKDRPDFNLDDLLRASAQVLGKGSLGTTYKVMMETGPAVVVKRLSKEMNSLSKKEFVQQMKLLGQIRHENLVQIISFHYSKEEKLIIHEFVPDGSLFELLHENRGIGRIPLNWSTRLSIIKDIARGLTYLHHSLPSNKVVPHANLKSSNVLLTQQSNHKYQSKLSDFGFLPLLPTRKSSAKLTIAKSPEFSDTKKITYKSDVYSFGIILLEVITGKIPGEISSGFGRGEGSTFDDLADWVRMVVNNDWSTDILDMEILSAKEGHEEMLKLTELALHCTEVVPENRPNMSHVLSQIEEIEPICHEQEQEQHIETS